MMTLSNLRKIRHLSFIFILSFSFFFGIIQSARIYIMLSLYSTHHNFYHVSYPKECAFPFTSNYAGVPVCTFESVYAPDPHKSKKRIYSMLDYTNAEITDDIFAYTELQNKVLTNRYCAKIIEGYDNVACHMRNVDPLKTISPKRLVNDASPLIRVYIYAYTTSLNLNDYKIFEHRIKNIFISGIPSFTGSIRFMPKNITFDRIQYENTLWKRELYFIHLHKNSDDMEYPLETVVIQK